MTIRMNIYDLRQPDIEAEVTYFFRGESEKEMKSGCRPSHVLIDGYLTVGHHEYLERNQVAPGETATAHIWFVLPEVLSRTLWIGRKIAIHEGADPIGCARVTKILAPSLERIP